MRTFEPAVPTVGRQPTSATVSIAPFRPLPFAAAAIIAGVLHAAFAPSRLALPPLLAVCAIAVAGSLFVAASAPQHRLVVWHHIGVVIAASVIVGAAWPGETTSSTLDAVLPATFTMIAVGRYGCHRGGCCYGRPARTGLVYATSRLPWSAAAYRNVVLAPVQLAEGVGCAVIATVGGVANAAALPNGTTAAIAVLGYAGVRIATEAWRGDPNRGGTRTTNEATITAAIVACAVVAARSLTSTLNVFDAIAISFVGAAVVYHRSESARRQAAPSRPLNQVIVDPATRPRAIYWRFPHETTT